MHSHTTHTHTQRINALGLPPAISVGFPLLLLLLLSLSLFSLAAAPPLREGGRERESQRERERKIPTSQLWKPQLLARPRGYTSSLPANRNGGVRTARFHAKAATDLIGQTKETKKSPCAHESRGRKRETSLWFSKESEGERRGWEGRLLGVGKGLEIHGCPKVRFYSVRNDTTRLPPWLLRRLAVDVKKEEEGGSTYAAVPGEQPTGDGFLYPDSITDKGAEATAPLRATRHTWHAPLSPPPRSTLRGDGRGGGRGGGGVCWGAIFKSLLLPTRCVFCCRRAAARPAFSCYTLIWRRRARTEENKGMWTESPPRHLLLFSLSLFVCFYSCKRWGALRFHSGEGGGLFTTSSRKSARPWYQRWS